MATQETMWKCKLGMLKVELYSMWQRRFCLLVLWWCKFKNLGYSPIKFFFFWSSAEFTVCVIYCLLLAELDLLAVTMSWQETFVPSWPPHSGHDLHTTTKTVDGSVSAASEGSMSLKDLLCGDSSSEDPCLSIANPLVSRFSLNLYECQWRHANLFHSSN